MYVCLSFCLSVCLSVCLYVCLFHRISVSFACMELTFVGVPGVLGGDSCIKQFPRGRDVTKEPTFDAEYVTQYSS